jgi:hypothetical protein
MRGLAGVSILRHKTGSICMSHGTRARYQSQPASATQLMKRCAAVYGLHYVSSEACCATHESCTLISMDRTNFGIKAVSIEVCWNAPPKNMHMLTLIVDKCGKSASGDRRVANRQMYLQIHK